jgi:hypothetical protein
MKDSDGRTSRRRALRIGVTTASAAVVGAAVGGEHAAASPEGSGSSADYGATGRVSAISGQTVDVDLLAGLTGPAARRVVGHASMPLVGFSNEALPRIGDLVAVTTTTPGYDVAAAPMIHRVTGVPRAAGNGVFVVAGERIADHPALRAAGRARTRITVSAFDTQLPVARVFAVRPVEQQ